FALPAPWLLVAPAPGQWPLVALAAALAVASLLLLSWAYARAEAQVLLTVEYTAFIWAAIMGWLFFREPLTLVTVAG
ncbi:EamA/RhaT family transporter, partial [Escherichia coli]|nr:EamA/RhaT family transporter [Escherichia coli]